MPSNLLTLALVSGAALVASAINAVAGGGTFLTFPTLTGIGGLSEKIANMTSTIGLWPGSAASVVAAKKDFARLPRGQLLLFSVLSLCGGLAGSVLLITTPNATFRLVIPWLLAFATVIFGFSRPIAQWAGRRHGSYSWQWTLLVAALQMLVAVYGGYFGAGIGVLMLAGLSFAGLENIHQVNALKVLLATIINGVSVLVFALWPIVTGSRERVDWPLAAGMVVASIIGGFFGMALARRIKPTHLRGIILLVGITLTAVYFYKAYVGT